MSDARWWDPVDLEDEKIRDKVVESLSLIKPLVKSEWTDFHRNTDRLVAEYTPQLQDALRQTFQGDTVRHAIRAAYTATKAKKTTKTTRRTRRQGPVSATATMPGLTGTGAAPALGIGPAGSSLALLHSRGPSIAAIVAILIVLYAIAHREGSQEAAQATGTEPSPDGLEQLQAEAEHVAHGVAHTQTERIARAIAEGVQAGEPYEQVEQRVEQIIDTTDRAEMITENEYVKGWYSGALHTYQDGGVEQLQWLHMPGACQQCIENHLASPQPAQNPQWPNGTLPVHPHERCAVVPWSGDDLLL